MNPEDLLSDALHHRVERTDYPSTPLSTVAGRAGAIRARRRRTTALAAAAAVGVVVVPGAVWLHHSPDGSPRPGQSLSSGPSSSPTGASSTPPSTALADLPVSHKPGIDYLVGDTYVTMNGDRITHPLLTKAVAATPVRGGILVSTGSRLSGLGDLVLETDSGDQGLGCGSERFAMSTDGVYSAYWLMDSCTAGSAGRLYSGVNNTMGESGGGFTPTPAGSVYEPIGIVRQGTVVNVTHAGTEHTVIVDASGSGNPITTLAYAGGSDENNDVVSGQLATNGNTGGIVDAASGAVKVRVPGWVLGQFSNDGKYLLGYQPGNGIGADRYAVFDAITGSQVVELHLGTAEFGAAVGVRGPAWDFDDTVLAVADGFSSGEAIVRFDLDGNLTRATPVADTAGTYRLATRP